MANEERNNPAAPAAVAAPPSEAPPRKPGVFQRNPYLRTLLRLLAVLVLIGVAVFWWQSRKFQDTDDAQIDGHIDPISARGSGHVVKVNVEEGQSVKAG